MLELDENANKQLGSKVFIRALKYKPSPLFFERIDTLLGVSEGVKFSLTVLMLKQILEIFPKLTLLQFLQLPYHYLKTCIVVYKEAYALIHTQT